MQTIKKEQLEALRKKILCLQGLGTPSSGITPAIPLGSVLAHMPGGIFPTGVHEFISTTQATVAATSGFISALAGFLTQGGKSCLWVSKHTHIFPPALTAFGIAPEQIFFINATREKEILWTLEEGLKCKTLGVVVGEVKELDFMRSRRLQLAVESSKVTALIHRPLSPNLLPTACISRWQITPANSRLKDKLPGLGFPRWKAELLKIRNGKPGSWILEWRDETFHVLDTYFQEKTTQNFKTDIA